VTLFNILKKRLSMEFLDIDSLTTILKEISQLIKSNRDDIKMVLVFIFAALVRAIVSGGKLVAAALISSAAVSVFVGLLTGMALDTTELGEDAKRTIMILAAYSSTHLLQALANVTAPLAKDPFGTIKTILELWKGRK